MLGVNNVAGSKELQSVKAEEPKNANLVVGGIAIIDLPDLISGKKKLSPFDQKFDIDKDGKLDDAEKAARDAYKETKKFDINGNGKLDPEEKAALDAYKKAKEEKKHKFEIDFSKFFTQKPDVIMTAQTEKSEMIA